MFKFCMIKVAPIILLVSLLAFYSYNEYKNNFFMFSESKNISELEKKYLNFVESTDSVGITHTHEVYKKSEKMKNYKNFIPTNVAVAVSDINNDGYPDILFTNGTYKKGSYFYLNNKRGSFYDATSQFELDKSPSWLNVAHVALFFDYNNDGFKDLFIGHEGCHQLYKNINGKKFIDVSQETGISKICGFLSSARLIDFNKDGFPDLYLTTLYKSNVSGGKVADFFSPRSNKVAKNSGGPNILLKNNLGEKFSIIDDAGGAGNGHLAWDSAIVDINQDGWPDIVVANDFSVIKTFINQKNDTFFDSTTEQLGQQYESANMGISLSDINNDGQQDFFVTNVSRSTYTPTSFNHMYVQNTSHAYKDLYDQYGIDKCGWAWGSQFADFDNDGLDELIVSNGMFDDGEKDYFFKWMVYTALPAFLVAGPEILPNTAGHYLARKQRNCFFKRQKNDTAFKDVTLSIGIDDLKNGRGTAVIDVNNDGRLSIAIANFADKPSFYKNISEKTYHWIGFELIGNESGKDAYGTILKLKLKDKIITKVFNPSQGYSAQNDPRVKFGLFDNSKYELEITWPSGKTFTSSSLEMNKYHQIKE